MCPRPVIAVFPLHERQYKFVGLLISLQNQVSTVWPPRPFGRWLALRRLPKAAGPDPTRNLSLITGVEIPNSRRELSVD
jgi:hypothetical protein